MGKVREIRSKRGKERNICSKRGKRERHTQYRRGEKVERVRVVEKCFRKILYFVMDSNYSFLLEIFFEGWLQV